jgi:hypothetical protein
VSCRELTDAQKAVLDCALVKFFLAIQQNTEYFVRKLREFFNNVQIAACEISLPSLQ